MTQMSGKTDFENCGPEMHALMAELFPICRSLTGNGVRETLRVIQRHIPFTIVEVPSGTTAFDWIIPKEWNITDAYVLDENGKKIVDFQKSNLHVVGYSVPVNKTVSLSELQGHLHSLEDQPNAIPYVTSYYEERWGFCIPHDLRQTLKEGSYKVVIDSELKDGHLTYAELIIPGELEQEIFLSTYVCHPSMANNELSGPVVTTMLAKWIASEPRRYTYRIIFIPETIGSLTYLSRHLSWMKEHVITGFNVTCVGDDRAYSYVPSRHGNTLADKVALAILHEKHPDFIRYSYLDRGSDERQYCSPGVDLPVVSVMRSKYRAYPEYHTSLDNLEVVTPTGLQGGFAVLRDCVELLEKNRVYRATCLGEPQLGRRQLFPSLGTRKTPQMVMDTLNVLAYADGKHDLVGISTIARIPFFRLFPIVDELIKAGLFAEVAPTTRVAT
jgi:aminopeptidase-like protein